MRTTTRAAMIPSSLRRGQRYGSQSTRLSWQRACTCSGWTVTRSSVKIHGRLPPRRLGRRSGAVAGAVRTMVQWRRRRRWLSSVPMLARLPQPAPRAATNRCRSRPALSWEWTFMGTMWPTPTRPMPPGAARFAGRSRSASIGLSKRMIRGIRRVASAG